LQVFWLSYKRVQPAGQIHEYERVRMRFASTRFGRPDTLRCIWKRSHSFASASAYRLWHPEAAVASFRDMVKRQILARMTRDRQHSLTPTGNFACPAFLSLRCKRHPTHCRAPTAAHSLLIARIAPQHSLQRTYCPEHSPLYLIAGKVIKR
jgi:hypothetical protein